MHYLLRILHQLSVMNLQRSNSQVLLCTAQCPLPHLSRNSLLGTERQRGLNYPLGNSNLLQLCTAVAMQSLLCNTFLLGTLYQLVQMKRQDSRIQQSRYMDSCKA
jgi:hypothetical protein